MNQLPADLMMVIDTTPQPEPVTEKPKQRLTKLEKEMQERLRIKDTIHTLLGILGAGTGLIDEPGIVFLLSNPHYREQLQDKIMLLQTKLL